MRRIFFMTVTLSTLVSITPISAQDTSGEFALPEPRLDRNGVPEGHVVIGDLLIPEEALDDLGSWLENQGTFTTSTWPNGVVPFVFADTATTFQRQQATTAMNDLEAVSAVDFRAATQTDIAWIFINPHPSANNAQVGYGLGPRTVNVTSWNSVPIITHELLHALGVWHEQSRTDRDLYVEIESENISQTACGGSCDHNFQIEAFSRDYGPYDFGSVMHYGACAFSVCSSCTASDPNCRTITVKSPWDVDWQANIGQRTGMSYYDEVTVSFLYPESNWRFVDQGGSNLLEFGTFLDPWKSLSTGVTDTPSGGTLWIEPGTYTGNTVLTGNLTLRAAQGGVLIAP